MSEVTEKHTLKSLLAYSNDLFNQLVESGGELSPIMEEQLKKLEISIPEKVDAYHYLMDRLEAEAEFWKQKAEFYAVIMRGCLDTREKIKNNLKLAMHDAGIDELKGNDIRFKLSATKPALKINDELVDEIYKTQVVETIVDRKRVEEDIRLGIPVAGAHLVPSFAIKVYANKRDK